MHDARDVLPIGALIGMPVVSRATGNKLGQVRDVFVDPVNGQLAGLTVETSKDVVSELSYDGIYSFGQDAIMAESDESVRLLNNESPMSQPVASQLIGAKVISESGDLLGQISSVFLTLRLPSLTIYEVRASFLDKLLGREFFILGSTARALSSDRKRLIVRDDAIDNAAPDINALLDQIISVRSFSPSSGKMDAPQVNDDHTWVPAADEDETVVRSKDEDETVIHFRRRAGSRE